MRTPLIAGNWKMHKTLAEARELVGGIREGIKGIGGVEVVICPPFHHLFAMAKAIDDSPVMLGAQNAHYEAQGAFTGEVSVPMLKDAGCTHVILGHSERRQYFAEDGPLLAKKVRAAVAGGLNAIFCVGETLQEREADRTRRIVERHISDVIKADVPAERLIIAYEPVWAIGTGRTATPDQAQEVHAFVRAMLASTYGQPTAEAVRILYGGSVKPGNAADLLAQPDIDGALVGGACLVPADFAAIIKAAGTWAAVSS
ncbi:MAG: triose-phosphate isomerase [Phycisphaerales bacterium]|nr:MAG: triose-phosphate isomerase [Phycisphaerales bacterium]